MITLPDPVDWLRYEERVGFPSAELRSQFPDFLVMSPARTATTWLYENLRCHPQICVGPAKEIRYFDSRWRRHDASSYCALFRRQHGRIAGDVSPSYSLLPSSAIRHIQVLNPDLKIILLLREPTDRAWSHLRHTIRYREANFASYPPGATVTPSLDEIVQNFVHDYTLSSGDYESIVLRWMRHFPPSQFQVAFFEEATATPERYLVSLFHFLGAGPIASFKNFPLDKKQNAAGMTLEMPSEAVPWLGRLHRVRRKRLERLLQRTFGLTTPWPVLPAEEDHADPLRLPDLPNIPEGWFVELGEGWFRGRRVRGAKSGAGSNPNRTRSTRRTEFVGDLVEYFEPDHASLYEVLRLAGWSVEDRRLARELDAIAHSAP